MQLYLEVAEAEAEQALSIERNVFTATANQTAFVISSAITSSSNTQVYIDGVYQSKDNYTTSGSTVTFSVQVYRLIQQL